MVLSYKLMFSPESRLNGDAAVQVHKRALMIRPGALGDTLLTIPALAELSENAEIALTGRGPGLYFARRWASEIQDMEGPGWHRLFSREPHSEALPLRLKPDRVLALFNNPTAGLEKNLRSYFPQAELFIMPSLPPENLPVHVAEHIATCLARAGLMIDPARAMKHALSRALLRPAFPPEDRKRLVFHPGSGSPKKNLPLSFWIDLVRKLSLFRAFEGTRPICLLGPAEYAARHPFLCTPPDNIETVLCQDPEPMEALLSSACLYLGHDSGVTHLAAMMGLPTVAFFQSPNQTLWRPLGPHAMILSKEASEKRLLSKTFEALADLSGSTGRPLLSCQP